jgi:hypothetical protein
MVNPKPVTLWAVASLVCSALGCLAVLTFLVFAKQYGEAANRSAGVGAIWMGMHIMLTGLLYLLGVLLGVVALVRIRGGEYRGRGAAWAGIVLGCSPLAAGAVLFLMSNADSNPLR